MSTWLKVLFILLLVIGNLFIIVQPVGADELGTLLDKLYGTQNIFVGVVARLTDDDIVGVDIVHGDTGIVEGVDQTRFADYVGAPSGSLT